MTNKNIKLLTKELVCLKGRNIGKGFPCFIIAEAGVNHNGDINIAKELIDIAVEAKADAVKFQSFKAELNVTEYVPLANYQKRNAEPETTQLSLLKNLELSQDQHYELLEYCNNKGILFMSSVFDYQSVDLLEEMFLPVHKIPSGELTNLPLLSYIAQKNKPIILSTGMSTMDEVISALKCIYATGNTQVVVLHCVSSYPVAPKEVNLKAMLTMRDELNVEIGYSDHTKGIAISLAAVSIGASVIEKHYTVDRSMPGPDHEFSLEKLDLINLVRSIREVESAMGSGKKIPTKDEMETATVSRKSIVMAVDIDKGTIIRKSMIAMKSPGTGIPPSLMDRVIGKKINTKLKKDCMITWEMI
ncbi:MAG: N-acetylneuraminate synthase [Candidatus Poseidoniia archaeon]|jgi:N-acetylneuraminate synthase|nr:N-acetylneuraminate synthase [Candidatus Poseidoniia archaeon]|tara:strand:+ start:67 stop:1143 length:1077 start_codon:yes stop_codon:yes gene_type:complete